MNYHIYNVSTEDCMNGEIKFRTGLGGYNKDDVNKYIKDTDIKFSTQI